MGKYTQKQFSEDIYDLIKECALPKGQNDEWAVMSRKFAKEARKNIGEYLREKNIEWNGDTNKIHIGRSITIIITDFEKGS
jgi:hypothetical protein